VHNETVICPPFLFVNNGFLVKFKNIFGKAICVLIRLMEMNVLQIGMYVSVPYKEVRTRISIFPLLGAHKTVCVEWNLNN